MSEPVDNPDTLRERALTALRAGRHDEARALLERALVAAPDDPLLHSNLGNAWHLCGDLPRALAAHRNALALGERASALSREQRAWLHYNVGVVTSSLDRLDEAREAYCQALAVVPDMLVAIESLGTVWQRLGEHERALALYRQVIESAPSRASGYRNLGSALGAMGRLDEARDAYREACSVAPSDPAVWLDLAAVEQVRGDLDAAIDGYRRACQLAPTSLDAPIRLGRALLAAGRLDEAESAHRRALSLTSETAPVEAAVAHNALGATLVGQGRYQEALTHLQRAIAAHPDWALPHYNLGVALQYSGREDAAVSAYRAAIANGANGADLHNAWNHLADCLRQLQRYARAADAYEQLLAIDPDNVSARYLRAALRGEGPDAPPSEYIRRLFDDYAPRFDSHLVHTLAYRMPTVIRAAVGDFLAEYRGAAVLDLGCGTGLVGDALRPLVTTMHGVDLSPNMLARAEQRAVYDQLFNDDVISWLADDTRGRARYQLITAADVLIYLGDLEPLFTRIPARLARPGRFVFTIEELAEPTAPDRSFALLPTGRYAHNRAYIDQLATRYGLREIRAQPVDLRTERDRPVPGVLYILELGHGE